MIGGSIVKIIPKGFAKRNVSRTSGLARQWESNYCQRGVYKELNLDEASHRELAIEDFKSIERFENWKGERAEIEEKEAVKKKEQEDLRAIEIEKKRKSREIESLTNDVYKIPKFKPYGKPSPTFYPDKDGFVRQR